MCLKAASLAAVFTVEVEQATPQFRVFAMARPARSRSEVSQLRAAVSELGLGGSRRAVAGRIAKRVADLAIGLIALDDFELALSRLEIATSSPALAELVFGEDAPAGRLLFEIALARFEARGCRHAFPADVAEINRSIAVELRGKLAERWRKMLG